MRVQSLRRFHAEPDHGKDGPLVPSASRLAVVGLWEDEFLLKEHNKVKVKAPVWSFKEGTGDG